MERDFLKVDRSTPIALGLVFALIPLAFFIGVTYKDLSGQIQIQKSEVNRLTLTVIPDIMDRLRLAEIRIERLQNNNNQTGDTTNERPSHSTLVSLCSMCQRANLLRASRGSNVIPESTGEGRVPEGRGSGGFEPDVDSVQSRAFGLYRKYFSALTFRAKE